MAAQASAPAPALDLRRPRSADHTGVGLLVSLLAHALLVAALTLGVQWHDEAPAAVEAELWAEVPTQAAPPAAEPSPEPAAEPVAEPPPEPVETTPPPVATPAPVKPTPTPKPDPAELRQQQRDADIAREQAREKQRQQDKARREAEQREAERKEAARKEADRKEAEDKAAKDKEKERQRQQQLADKEAQQRKLQQQKEQAEQQKRDKEEAARREAQRAANLRRLTEQAGGVPGGTGAPGSSGSAAVSAGPSAGYAGRIKAYIKPNIVLTDSIPGNPTTEVEVRTLPDGSIVGKRITKPSGNRDWDEAVLRAIERTAKLPRDTDGRIPPTLLITFKPNE